MNPTEQIADEMARKAVSHINSAYHQNLESSKQAVDLMSKWLKEAIPLVELLNVARAAKVLCKRMEAVYKDPRFIAVWASYANHGGDYSDGPKWFTKKESLEKSLATLESKLGKEIEL